MVVIASNRLWLGAGTREDGRSVLWCVDFHLSCRGVLAPDTLDGTHYGWQTNAFKMRELLCALAKSGNASEVQHRKFFSACKQLLVSDEGQGVDRGKNATDGDRE